MKKRNIDLDKAIADREQRKSPTPGGLDGAMYAGETAGIDTLALLSAMDGSAVHQENDALHSQIMELQNQLRLAVTRTDGGVSIAGCVGNAAGLDIPSNIGRDDFEFLVNVLLDFEGRLQLFIGDMLVAADQLGYGDIKRLAERIEKEADTLYKWKSICQSVTTFLRRKVLEDFPTEKPLTISHYEMVMALEVQDQYYWLSQAIQNGWTVAQLRVAVRGNKLPPPPPSPSDRFWDDWNRFRKTQMSYWKSAPDHERQQIAEVLRKLADDLTSSD